LASVSSIALLALVVVASWSRPVLSYDAWYYHLPFASRLWGIGGGAAGFVLAPFTQAMYDGYPLVAEWLQGALWWATRSLHAVALVNSLALVALVAYARVSFGLPTAPLVFGSLAVPLVAIHATSAYIDLVSGALVALAGLAAVRLLELASNDERRREGSSRLHAALFLGAAGLAGNTKYQSYALTLFVTFYVVVAAMARSTRRARRRALVGLAVGAALVASLTVARNVWRFGAPFYPHEMSSLLPSELRPERKQSDASKHKWKRPPAAYTEHLGAAQRPVEFLLSATELDWWLRGVEARYDIDSSTGDRPQRYFSIRMGGWWGLWMVLLAAAALAEAVRRRRTGWSAARLHLTRLVLLLTGATALQPYAYILRYWMALPLLFVVLVTALAVEGRGRRAVAILSLGSALAFGWSFGGLSTSASFRPWPARRLDAASLRRNLDPDLRRAIEHGDAFCLDGRHAPMHFRYSRAVIGGEHVVEQVLAGDHCVKLPLLDIERTVRPRAKKKRARGRER